MLPWTPILEGGQTPIVLVRHGQTAWNLQRRFLGRTDRPLDATGRAQVAWLSHWSGAFEAVYSSPLSRALQTATALAPPRARHVDALAELDQGHLEGLSAADAMERYADFFASWDRDPAATPVPGGGRLADARDAAMVAIVDIARRHRGPVAVVGHQLVTASVMATLTGDGLAAWRRHKLGNAGWAMLAFDGHQLRVAVGPTEAGVVDPPV
mgnify:CR=1 FL=1